MALQIKKLRLEIQKDADVVSSFVRYQINDSVLTELVKESTVDLDVTGAISVDEMITATENAIKEKEGI